MKIVSPKVISFLAGAALIGLCVIQYYWISGAVSQRTQHFEQDVRDVLVNVSRRYSRAQTALRLRRQLAKPITPGLSQNQYLLPGLAVKDSLASAQNPLRFSSVLNSLARRPDLLQRPAGELFNNLYNELIRVNTWGDYSNQIDTSLVDTLLREELVNHGVNTRYVWAIINPPVNVFSSNGADPEDALRDSLLTSHYRVSLTPDNIFAQPRMLTIYFPFQKTFILRSMWLMLLLSVLFVLFILLLFYYSISTIYRQKKLSEVKNDFISNMTHELKTPISTISLACEVLSDQSVEKTKERLSRYVTMINDENKRLSGLVENVLQSAILDKGDFSLKLSETDLHELINEAATSVRLQVEKKEGEIITQLEAFPATIECDRTHILNIIFNLLDNAIKYTPSQPAIRVLTRSTPQGIELCVQDNGVGINKENQKRIFEKLYRVPTGNVHDVKGFGLGLSYVKAIVVKHGGQIRVESELGKGSRFYITLPYYISQKTN